MSEAFDIYQDHLDAASRALWERDYDTVVGLMVFPQKIVIADRVAEMPDAANGAERARALRESLSNLAATAYHRLAKLAEFDPDDPDLIHGEHEVYVLRGATYAITPYRVRMDLRRVDGRWLCSNGHILETPPGLRYGPLEPKSPAA